MSNDRINIFKYLLLVPILVFFYFFFNENDNVRDEQIKDVLIEYPLIEKSSKDYKGVVCQFSIGHQLMAGKGIYVTLSNGDKFVIGTSSNTTYKNNDLKDYFQVNDSIYYNHKTYEFFIYKKDGKELYFKLFN